jgi:hypothetical protein
MPAVIHPWRMSDADLAQHLGREMQQREGLVITFDAQLRPIAHRTPLLHFAARHC